MTSVQLGELLKEVLRNYWRQRIALKLFKLSSIKHNDVPYIEYVNIPQLGDVANFLVREETQVALVSVETNLENRVPRDLFIALLANFESFLSEALVLCGVTPSGTLGRLQNMVQQNYTVPGNSIEKVDEIRERRNALIHHNGIIDSKYVNAANKVIFPPWVLDPTLLTAVEVTPEYLTYVAATLIEYAKAIIP